MSLLVTEAAATKDIRKEIEDDLANLGTAIAEFLYRGPLPTSEIDNDDVEAIERDNAAMMQLAQELG